jgi:hypothetical protein
MNATQEEFVLGTKYDVACVVLQMVYGLVRGMRFWDFTSAMQTWAWLLPVFQQVTIFSSYLTTAKITLSVLFICKNQSDSHSPQ